MGWFGRKKDPTAAELRQELFSLLKDGQIEEAESDRYKSVTFDNCVVNVSATFGLYFTLDGRDGSKIKLPRNKLSDLNEWTVDKRRRFFQHESTYKSSDQGVVSVISYFAMKGDFYVVKFLLTRGADATEGQDVPNAENFRAPIYQCLNNFKIMELLLSHGAKPTNNVCRAAVGAMTSVDETGSQPIKALLCHGAKVDIITDEAKKLMSKSDFDKFKSLLLQASAVCISSVSLPAVTPEDQGSPDKPVSSFVSVDKDYGGVKITHIYDFNDYERKTLTVKPNGEKKVDLCESFNALGRKHSGLQEAIAAYQAQGGVFDPDACFSDEKPQRKISLKAN